MAEVFNPGVWLKKIFGSRNERVIKGILPLAGEVNVLEPEYEALSDQALQAKTEEFRSRLSKGETVDDLLPEAFAAAREAAKRTLGNRLFDVQIIGAIVLHRGAIAEMTTGEGKTLTSVAPAYLNALVGRGVHIVTVNDYLARRDAAWNGPVFEALGMTVGCIQAQMHSNERIPQYQADVTYGTNSEFGFDYLRDNMKTRIEDQCQRHRHFAIIDEVDSILIDEARTPLIISGPTDETTDKYYLADRVVRRWRQQKRGIEKADLDDLVDEHARKGSPQEKEEARLRLEGDSCFVYSEKNHTAYLTETGIVSAQQELGIPDFYTPERMHENWPHHLEQAVRAHMIYNKEVEYVVKGGEVIIVDEFTGRLMEGRRWSDGLHQAVEAKEGIKPKEENQTLATVTIQNYFRLYEKLSGMTGTALTEAAEFFKIYQLDVVVVPTNRPLLRLAHDDKVFLTEKEKYNAAVEEIARIFKEGRPALVGTASIEASEMLSRMLVKRGVPHEVLNAKHHEREALIVAKAGQAAVVTIATNMAGRGTDILLGDGVAGKGGLHIVGTERHEARRIDNQLRGRAGRQGDPGSSVFFVSLEDPLMRRFAREGVKRLLARLGMGDGQEITAPMVSRAIERAQKKVEQHNFDVRKNLLEYDQVNDDQRKAIYGLRTALLRGEQLEETAWELIDAVIQPQLEEHFPSSKAPAEWAAEEVTAWARRKFGIEVEAEALRSGGSAEAAGEVLRDAVRRQMEQMREALEEAFDGTLRFLLIQAIDDKWKEHLRELDALREGIGLRGYAQVDPKSEYKREASLMFNEMQQSIAEAVTENLFKVSAGITGDMDDLLSGRWQPSALTQQEISAFEAPDTAPIGSTPDRIEPIRRDRPKVGRNDPCPCGSGKKYKKCCGRNE